MQINDSIIEKQEVSFVLDSSKDFEKLSLIDISIYQKTFVICDDSLKSSWWPKLKKKISTMTEVCHVEFVTSIESSKDLKSFTKLVDVLAEKNCSRDNLIIAIGGGIVLDIVGFLASTYMRGIALMMIPTTLIGQADASTAGKTCLNTKDAKNLLGTLYLPRYVYNNVTILSTSSKYHMRQGFSEIFKYALLGSSRLLDLLRQYHIKPCDETMVQILNETIKVRLITRKKHPLASNFGHTFGHAFEKLSNYSVGHGDAISVGMVLALDFSVEEKIISTQERDKIVSMMKNLGLNTALEVGIDSGKIVQLMQKDKKSSGAKIRLVLIEEIGKPYEKLGNRFYEVSPERMKKFLDISLVKYSEKNCWKNLRG